MDEDQVQQQPLTAEQIEAINPGGAALAQGAVKAADAFSDHPAQDDSIEPTSSPLDFLPYGKIGSSLAKMAGSDAVKDIVGNEIGGIGSNVKGTMVHYPVSIDGVTARPDTGDILHSTVKTFQNTSPEDIVKHAESIKFKMPDPSKIKIEPGIFNNAKGEPIHVLKMSGQDANLISDLNSKFNIEPGKTFNGQFTPHISVDPQTWQRVKDSGAKTAAEAGIQFANPELRMGDQVLHKFDVPASTLSTQPVKPIQKYADGGVVDQSSTTPTSDAPQMQSPDFIPDNQFTPDPAPQSNMAGQNAPDFIPDNQFQPDPTQEDKYGTTEQMVKTGLEGAARGVIGPLAPLAERVLGVNPEDIRGRQEANPITAGASEAAGFGASMLSGIGEAGLVAKAGEAAAKGLGVGLEGAGLASRIAASATRAAAETALLQTGDEVSKLIVNDPNQSLQTAVAHVGLGALLGGAAGTALGSIGGLWKATLGDKLGQTVADFKGRIGEHINNPDPVSAITDELGALHKSVTDMASETYGATGLKAQDIAKVMPEMSDKIATHAGDIAGKFDSALQRLSKDNNVGMLEDVASKYKQAVNSNDPAEIFNATQEAKQQLQEWGKYNKDMVPLGERAFRNTAKDLAQELRVSLEDPKVWGQAGERQEAINGAFSKFLPSLKDFEKKFAIKTADGSMVIDPGKVNTYVNQLGKPNAEIKQEFLRNFLNSSDKFQSVISDTHANLGIDNPFTPTSLVATNGSLKKITPGAKLADLFIQKGLTDAGGKAIGAGIGGAVGHTMGSGEMGAFIGAHALGPFFSSVLPAIAKPLLAKEVSSNGMKAALDYGLAVSKGETLISNATANVFHDVKDPLPSHLMPTDNDRVKLSKALSLIQSKPEIMMKGNDISHYLAEHGVAMTSTAATAMAYLNSLRPNRDRASPLDSPKIPSTAEKSKLNQALDIAQQPMIVMDKIKKGTLTPGDVMAMKSMYPDLYNRTSQKLMSEMTQVLSKGKSVPYKTRIGLSMFLGQPLDSTMTPGGIQSSQASFNNALSQAPLSPPKGGKMSQGAASSMSKYTKSYMTPLQLSMNRQLKH